jgi:hypothetical protein
MKAIALVALCLASVSSSAGESESWFRDWPQGSATDHELPAKLVAEIPHSLFDYAQELLKDRSLFAVGDNYFPGVRHNCPRGTSAYLVRALYEHPSNGTFQVYRFGKNLLVRHYALGARAQLHRSALLVCLSFTPEEVYVATGGAM